MGKFPIRIRYGARAWNTSRGLPVRTQRGLSTQGKKLRAHGLYGRGSRAIDRRAKHGAAHVVVQRREGSFGQNGCVKKDAYYQRGARRAGIERGYRNSRLAILYESLTADGRDGRAYLGLLGGHIRRLCARFRQMGFAFSFALRSVSRNVALSSAHLFRRLSFLPRDAYRILCLPRSRIQA